MREYEFQCGCRSTEYKVVNGQHRCKKHPDKRIKHIWVICRECGKPTTNKVFCDKCGAVREEELKTSYYKNLSPERKTALKKRNADNRRRRDMEKKTKVFKKPDPDRWNCGRRSDCLNQNNRDSVEFLPCRNCQDYFVKSENADPVYTRR